MTYADLAAGRRLAVYIQLQVNATNVGRRSQDVAVSEDGVELARVERTVTVFP